MHSFGSTLCGLSRSNAPAATRAAFGAPQATDDETRLCPLQLLRYTDVDVLVGQTGEPGEARHGCEADLSATMLKRAPSGYRRAHLLQFR